MSDVHIPTAPPPLDDEVRWILGRPNFWCAGIASILRVGGHKIETRAEDEQAVTIHWMLTCYLQHGSAWRAFVEQELTRIVGESPAATTKSTEDTE